MISVILCLLVLSYGSAYGDEATNPDDGCIPNRSYKVQCNSCICTPNKKLSICTVAACIDSEKETCTTGQMKEETCQSCFCTTLPSGKSVWACTKIPDCVDSPPSEDPKRRRRESQNCNVGDTKQEDCNMCKCVQDFEGNTSWGCTRRFCLGSRSRRDVNLATDFKDTPCAPNDSFELPNCITCYCNGAKTGYMCSANQCPGENATESGVFNVTKGIPKNLVIGDGAFGVNFSNTTALIERTNLTVQFNRSVFLASISTSTTIPSTVISDVTLGNISSNISTTFVPPSTTPICVSTSPSSTATPRIENVSLTNTGVDKDLTSNVTSNVTVPFVLNITATSTSANLEETNHLKVET